MNQAYVKSGISLEFYIGWEAKRRNDSFVMLLRVKIQYSHGPTRQNSLFAALQLAVVDAQKSLSESHFKIKP